MIELRGSGDSVSAPSRSPGPLCPVKKFYVLICRECWPEATLSSVSKLGHMPFSSAEDRGKWAAEHTKGTKHDRWYVLDVTK